MRARARWSRWVRGSSHVAPGDAVVLNWAPSCGACHFCTLAEPWLCANALLRRRPRPTPRTAPTATELYPGLERRRVRRGDRRRRQLRAARSPTVSRSPTPPCSAARCSPGTARCTTRARVQALPAPVVAPPARARAPRNDRRPGAAPARQRGAAWRRQRRHQHALHQLVNAGVTMVAVEPEPVGDQLVEVRDVQHATTAHQRRDHAQRGYGQRVERGIDPGGVPLLLLELVAPAAGFRGVAAKTDRTAASG